MEILIKLKKIFSDNYNSSNSFWMKKYLKNKFEFFGIKAPLRKKLSSDFLKKKNLPKKENLEKIVKELWNFPEREFQYFVIELLKKFQNNFEKKDIFILEYLILNKSWWDTVDAIASNLVGGYFKIHNENLEIIEKWTNSKIFWLNRVSLLFQLKYKEKTNSDLLFSIALKHSNSDEFFIQKAIGWALRELSKTKPYLVKNFVKKNKLKPLSEREALKIIKNFLI
ncbi:MAG: hypothetical protein B6I24_05285 [Bacteroidetes bacterium 4572_128]|nr:MAG: hypothetical protein B6I24_05285 [Bacteroidetes bacterium 4572_128]